MSLLTPLYILGLLAISVPVLLHLFRPSPRGRIVFSAVMFLDETPPRQTRRTRIENWLLLLLRGLALALLAAAFARPFLRNESLVSTVPTGRKLTLLIDVSASMRRGDVWRQAMDAARTAVADLKPEDEVTLATFDHAITTLLSNDDWNRIEPAARSGVLEDRLRSLRPGWGRSHLGAALMAAAEQLTAGEMSRPAHSPGAAEIVLISDLASGSRIDELKTSGWPADVRVTVRAVSAKQTTNAGLTLAAASASPTQKDDESKSTAAEASKDSRKDDDSRRVRVRVANAADSTRSEFRLRWRGDSESAALLGDPVTIHIPPGQTRIVSVIPSPTEAPSMRLELEGDEHDFDNQLVLTRPETEYVTVLFLGDDLPADPQGLRYYLERAFPITEKRSVQVLGGRDAEALLTIGNTRDVPLVVLAGTVADESAAQLQTFARGGGTIVVAPHSVDECAAWAALTGQPALAVTEADVTDYALLTDIQFSHPLWAGFREATFSDFSKIHVWKHRRIDPESIGTATVLAKFDGTHPAVIESTLGAGRVILLASAWNPGDSQWALSSKFAPLMATLLELSPRLQDIPSRLTVGDAIPLTMSIGGAISGEVRTPDSRTIPLAAGQTEFAETTVPGLYEVSLRDGKSFQRSRRMVVQVPPEESRTEPLPVELLETHGVVLTRPAAAGSNATSANEQRQRHAKELEQSQKLWRWLMLATAMAVLAETWVARKQPSRSA